MPDLGLLGRRLLLVGLALGVPAAVLRWAGASAGQIAAAASAPQAYVTAAGADQFVVVLATAIGWVLLGWVALGAVLTLGGAAPGVLGSLSRQVARLVLPATLRRVISLSLGLALLTGTSMAAAAPSSTVGATSVTVDWPAPQQPSLGGAPDWPSSPVGAGATTDPSGSTDRPDSPDQVLYVVRAGECLWDIAERALAQAGSPTDRASVALAVAQWWQANSSDIDDPDLIFPGQVLAPPPAGPTVTASPAS